MPPPRRRQQARDEGRITLAQATVAAVTLNLKLPATRLQLDIAYKRTVNRFARYLLQRGVPARRRSSWPLYRRYGRAYEVVQKFILLEQAGWRTWTLPRLAPDEELEGSKKLELEPLPTPADVMRADGDWEKMWGGLEYWVEETGEEQDEEDGAMAKVWAEVIEDISKP